jgi:hypothetical protein
MLNITLPPVKIVIMADKTQAFIEERQNRFIDEYNTLNLDTFMGWFSEHARVTNHGKLTPSEIASLHRLINFLRERCSGLDQGSATTIPPRCSYHLHENGL